MINLDKIINNGPETEKDRMKEAVRQALELACKESLECASEINTELFGGKEYVIWEDVVMTSKIINESIMSIMEEIE